MIKKDQLTLGTILNKIYGSYAGITGPNPENIIIRAEGTAADDTDLETWFEVIKVRDETDEEMIIRMMREDNNFKNKMITAMRDELYPKSNCF